MIPTWLEYLLTNLLVGAVFIGCLTAVLVTIARRNVDTALAVLGGTVVTLGALSTVLVIAVKA